MMRSQLRILSLALANVARHKGRVFATVAVYSLIVGIVLSVLLFVDSIDRQAHLLLSESPDLVIQKVTAGRHDVIPISRAEEIREIRGVKTVTWRVWGYSYDPPTESTFTLWGAESIPEGLLDIGDGNFSIAGETRFCAVGQGVADIRFLDLGDRLPIKGGDGKLYAPRIVGIFGSISSVLTHDLVVMPSALLQAIFAMDPGSATDLAVEVFNPAEVQTVGKKIALRWPDTRVVTRDQILQTYDAAFDWRGGIWLAMLVVPSFSFVVLVWDKASGLSAGEVRTIGILKAVGWSTRDVLSLKLWEGGIISGVSVLTGTCLAEIHLVLFDGWLLASVLKGWSVLYPKIEVGGPPNVYMVLVCMMFAVVPYLAATLVPSWRSSIVDPDTLVRG